MNVNRQHARVLFLQKIETKWLEQVEWTMYPMNLFFHPHPVFGINRRIHSSALALRNQYKGFWDLILQQPYSEQHDPRKLTNTSNAVSQTPSPTEPSLPDPPPSEDIELPTSLQPSVLLPPIPPTNCCMSGCANCVWDIYQSELEEYRDRKKASGQLEEGVQSIEDVDMDPGLKAFLEMEKMMSGRK